MAAAPMYAGVEEEEGGGLEGMPSKNLMVECRRRKRLNNREPSLQATSVVPRIIKTSRLTECRSWGRDRLHERAAGEDVATAGGEEDAHPQPACSRS
ncbi:transcription factor bHLH93-like [Triticum dicoccoides]|uniref:transcription factor bHLH93-like n=1 Tax=Triticum dicoccoides TaxID=85692 RepID=UPI00188E0275|nr:transcription factor bHLH93-like [Triticum dicoccoides]